MYKDMDFDDIFGCTTTDDERFLFSLLAPGAEDFLEEMARRAHNITLQQFGKTIQLYTPMYLSDFCENSCVYCGFKKDNDIKRKVLSLEEVEMEGRFIASTGLKHILILTGDSREHSPVSYIAECIKLLRKLFSSISIEIYALTESEYGRLVEAGVDSLTIYQEVYDERKYEKVHPSGPKKNYRFRLDAPERAAKSNVRSINIGVLLGLDEWRKEAFFTGLHAKYLQDKFPSAEISVSVPRVRPHGETDSFRPEYSISDKNIVQIITAMRLFMPRLGITISTREEAALRENLIPLGITRMSAGSTTSVGGHTIRARKEECPGQFDICDKRSVPDIKQAIRNKGYQAVLKDWMPI